MILLDYKSQEAEPKIKLRFFDSWISGTSSEIFYVCVCVCDKLLHHVQLCNPMDCSPPGSSVHGILQARILEWVAMPSSMPSIHPPGMDATNLMSNALTSRFFTTSAPWEAS